MKAKPKSKATNKTDPSKAKNKEKAKPSPKATQKKPAAKTKKAHTKTKSEVKKETKKKTKPPTKQQKTKSNKKEVLKMTKKDVYSRAYHQTKSSLFVKQLFLFFCEVRGISVWVSASILPSFHQGLLIKQGILKKAEIKNKARAAGSRAVKRVFPTC